MKGKKPTRKKQHQKKGRRKTRYWLRCTQCKAPIRYTEWFWKWKPSRIRSCKFCGGQLKECGKEESTELNRGPKREKSLKTEFTTYEAYLKSAHWRDVRSRILKRDGNKCRCGARAQQVHHRSYAPAVMNGTNDAMLISICEPCHCRITFREDGSKRSMQETERLLMLIEPGKPASP